MAGRRRIRGAVRTYAVDGLAEIAGVIRRKCCGERDTAPRDIAVLVTRGILVRDEADGRNTSYMK